MTGQPSSIPPEGSEHDDASEAQRLLQRVLSQRVAARTAEAQEAARNTFETHLDVVDDPAAAPRLSRRHNDQLISKKLIDLVLLYIDGGGNEAMFREIDEVLRNHVRRYGFFLEQYPVQKLEGRLADRHPNGEKKYLVVEASVSHPRAGAQGASQDPYADAQFALPTTADDAAHVLEMPREGDDLVNPDLVEELFDMPYAVASLDDVVCEPAMAGKHLASAALKRGLHEIKTVVNAGRGLKKIRYVTACLASVRGIRFKDGTTWNLQEDGRITPIFNERSAEMFEHMRNCPPFRTAFILRDREVAVDHPLVGSLIVDWHTKVAELKD
jgi:hypothetical protein